MDWYDRPLSFSSLSLQDNSFTGVYWRYDGDGVHDIMRRVGFALRAKGSIHSKQF